MGLIATILDFLSVNRNDANLNDVIVKPGGGNNVTAEQYIPIDKQPLLTDYAFIVKDSGTGRHVVLGYTDPINQSEANAGEEGIKGRNINGSIVCRIFARNDGTIQVNNDNGFFTLSPDGNININNVIINPIGNITTPQSIMAQNINVTDSLRAGGKEIVNHTHPAGTPPGNTGVNN